MVPMLLSALGGVIRGGSYNNLDTNYPFHISVGAEYV